MYKKVPSPARRYSPLTLQKRPPGIITVQNSSAQPTLLILGRGTHTMYYCIHSRKPEFEPIFW